MASATLITKGSTVGLTLQPGATVSINQDETVEASASFKTSTPDTNPPELGEEHPYEFDAKCYNITETRNQAGIITYD